MTPKNASQSASEGMAYLAGFFDGEGCIYPRNGLQVSASQIVDAPLLLLQQRLGGRVSRSVNGRVSPIFRWVIYGQPAARALATMLPWLVVKREQAEWALEYSKTVGPLGTRVTDPATKVERERLRQLILAARTANVSRRNDRVGA